MNRGDIYWVNLEPTQGAEIRKKRPCVSVQHLSIEQDIPSLLCLYRQKPRPPIAIPVDCLGRQAIAVCDQIRAVDKTRLLKLEGDLGMCIKSIRQLNHTWQVQKKTCQVKIKFGRCS